MGYLLALLRHVLIYAGLALALALAGCGAGLTGTGSGVAWQYQLQPPVDPTVGASWYDIDMFNNDASVVAALHGKGARVVCYINAGAWENWRPDAALFASQVLGANYVGWPGERWLDIRQISLLAPIMGARLDQCKTKGFDGVEADNMDGYMNATGFPLTAQDQLSYNLWFAQQAHARGLSMGLKNDAAQVPNLLSSFDWGLAEDCYAQGVCDQFMPFKGAGKPVFDVEYTDSGMTTGQFCMQASAMGINAILKHRSLDAWRQTCP